MLGPTITKESRAVIPFISQYGLLRGVSSLLFPNALLCNLPCIFYIISMEELPSITALAFRDSLNLAVGTTTGQVMKMMLYKYLQFT